MALETKWLGEVFEAELAEEDAKRRGAPGGGAAHIARWWAWFCPAGASDPATTNLASCRRCRRWRSCRWSTTSARSPAADIGTCLSSLLSKRNPDRTPTYGPRWDSFPFNPDTEGGAAQISHLRTHGSFLVTRKGLLTRETMHSIGVLLSGTVYHLALAALALTTVSLLYIALLFLWCPTFTAR